MNTIENTNVKTATPPYTLSTEIVIEAPIDIVWNVLVDNAHWEDWNPFIVKSHGQMKIGGRITNTMMLNGNSFTFKPVINHFEPNSSLSWKGQLIFPGIFDGEHVFNLISLPGGSTRFEQIEIFSGLLAGWFMRKYGKDTHDNFIKMNKALKTYVENK